MTVCGYYKNPLRGVADIYEEIYTGKAFIEKHNPGLIKGYDQIYVKLNNLNPLAIRKGVMVLTSTVIQENTAPSANTCTNSAGL